MGRWNNTGSELILEIIYVNNGANITSVLCFVWIINPHFYLFFSVPTVGSFMKYIAGQHSSHEAGRIAVRLLYFPSCFGSIKAYAHAVPKFLLLEGLHRESSRKSGPLFTFLVSEKLLAIQSLILWFFNFFCQKKIGPNKKLRFIYSIEFILVLMCRARPRHLYSNLCHYNVDTQFLRTVSIWDRLSLLYEPRGPWLHHSWITPNRAVHAQWLCSLSVWFTLAGSH
jgi:hypothetical protein